MPTMSLPSITRGTSVLNRLGQQAKQLGPDLFSPYQATNPVKTAAASSFAIPTAPSVGWNANNGPSLSPGNLFNTSMPQFKPPSLGGSFGSTSGTTTPSSGGGSAGSLGGEYAVLDQYDQYFQEASAATGIPVSTLKAIAAVERGWEGTSVAGAQGIMQVMPFWGDTFGLNLQDPRQNILAGAKVLASNLQEYGSMDMAIRGYLGFGQDAYGTTDQVYLQRVREFENQLNQSGGSFGTTQPINGMWGGNPVGNSFVQQAMQYVGVDYNWGAIPGANDNPWQTGWDCSGFTYFMNQKYGDKSLPMGSHYQYDYAIKTGKLFTNLDQLQPGDLVFIDTGWQGGAGAELNRAGHVAIYIGNGQIIHAANPSQGTIVSPISGYGGILGAMHQSTSGGYGGYSAGSSQASQGNSLLDAIMGFYRG